MTAPGSPRRFHRLDRHPDARRAAGRARSLRAHRARRQRPPGRPAGRPGPGVPPQGRGRGRSGRRGRADRAAARVRDPGRRRRPGQPGRGSRRRRQRRRRFRRAFGDARDTRRPVAAWRSPTRSRSSLPDRSCDAHVAHPGPSSSPSTASTAPCTSACAPTTTPVGWRASCSPPAAARSVAARREQLRDVTVDEALAHPTW